MCIVVVVLSVLVFAMALLLTLLNNVYDELTGRQRVERRSAWLRSMRAESERHVSQRVGITALERITRPSSIVRSSMNRSTSSIPRSGTTRVA